MVLIRGFFLSNSRQAFSCFTKIATVAFFSVVCPKVSHSGIQEIPYQKSADPRACHRTIRGGIQGRWWMLKGISLENISGYSGALIAKQGGILPLAMLVNPPFGEGQHFLPSILSRTQRFHGVIVVAVAFVEGGILRKVEGIDFLEKRCIFFVGSQ